VGLTPQGPDCCTQPPRTSRSESEEDTTQQPPPPAPTTEAEAPGADDAVDASDAEERDTPGARSAESNAP